MIYTQQDDRLSSFYASLLDIFPYKEINDSPAVVFLTGEGHDIYDIRLLKITDLDLYAIYILSEDNEYLHFPTGNAENDATLIDKLYTLEEMLFFTR